MIISFVNQKGGVGKTTTAVNLASSLARRNYHLVLVDLDPQGSAIKWHGVEGNQSFEILHQPGLLVSSDLAALAEAYDYVIVDAPPSICDLTRNVLEKSDIAIIPVTPSSLDLWSCTDTLKMVNAVRERNPRLRVKFLINRKIPGTRAGREIRGALDDFDTGIIDAELCQRVAYIDAMKNGVSVMQFAPGSKAAREIEQFSDEVVNTGGAPAAWEETDVQTIAAVYCEETDNILFRSFQGI